MGSFTYVSNDDSTRDFDTATAYLGSELNLTLDRMASQLRVKTVTSCTCVDCEELRKLLVRVEAEISSRVSTAPETAPATAPDSYGPAELADALHETMTRQRRDNESAVDLARISGNSDAYRTIESKVFSFGCGLRGSEKVLTVCADFLNELASGETDGSDQMEELAEMARDGGYGRQTYAVAFSLPGQIILEIPAGEDLEGYAEEHLRGMSDSALRDYVDASDLQVSYVEAD